jgi:hypothetical protein
MEVNVLDDCRGCTSYIRGVCVLIETGRIPVVAKCPCRDCLVKVTCESACETYSELTDNSVDLLEEEDQGLLWKQQFRPGKQ